METHCPTLKALGLCSAFKPQQFTECLLLCFISGVRFPLIDLKALPHLAAKDLKQVVKCPGTILSASRLHVCLGLISHDSNLNGFSPVCCVSPCMII